MMSICKRIKFRKPFAVVEGRSLKSWSPKKILSFYTKHWVSLPSAVLRIGTALFITTQALWASMDTGLTTLLLLCIWHYLVAL